MNDLLKSVLNFTPISRIRRNHALEHATLQILSHQYPDRQMAGHSDLQGCRIVGNIPGEDVQKAAHEALRRLREGDAGLAVHPNCGTNFAVGGSLAGMAGALAMLGAGRRLRDKLERLSIAAVFGTVALILAQPLSYQLQSKITTASDPLSLEIVQVVTIQRENIKFHRLLTRG
jgi:hypothetical protein